MAPAVAPRKVTWLEHIESLPVAERFTLASADQIIPEEIYFMPNGKYTGAQVLTVLNHSHWQYLSLNPYPGRKPVKWACGKSKDDDDSEEDDDSEYEEEDEDEDDDEDEEVSATSTQKGPRAQVAHKSGVPVSSTSTQKAPRAQVAQPKKSDPAKRARLHNGSEENSDDDDYQQYSTRAKKKRRTSAPAKKASSHKLVRCMGCKKTKKEACKGQHTDSRKEGEACMPCVKRGGEWVVWCVNDSWTEEFRQSVKP